MMKRKSNFVLSGFIKPVFECIKNCIVYWHFDEKWRLLGQYSESPFSWRSQPAMLILGTRAIWNKIKNRILIYIGPGSKVRIPLVLDQCLAKWHACKRMVKFLTKWRNDEKLSCKLFIKIVAIIASSVC